MCPNGSVGHRIDDFVATRIDTPVPEPRGLSRAVAPLPEWLENLALRLVWVIVAINLVGTAFGFWYYLPQLLDTPVVVWPIVPVSPLATLYMALSLTLWRLGYDGRLAQLVHVFAFFACLKYGLWSVYVQIAIEGPAVQGVPMWQFLIWSHAGMVVQAFVIQRYAHFPLWAAAIATAWFTVNDVFHFFVEAYGGPHHTWLNAFWQNGFDRTIQAYDYMVVAGLIATILATFLVVATRLAIERSVGD